MHIGEIRKLIRGTKSANGDVVAERSAMVFMRKLSALGNERDPEMHHSAAYMTIEHLADNMSFAAANDSAKDQMISSHYLAAYRSIKKRARLAKEEKKAANKAIENQRLEGAASHDDDDDADDY